jgi:outer membrane receptor protein involved in Fe transport
MKHRSDSRSRADSPTRDCLRLAACGAAALFAASYAGCVIADEPGDALEEITVTAQRRQENIRDVPISLTVFSATEIAQQNFQASRAISIKRRT